MSHTQNINIYNFPKPSKEPPPFSQLYATYKADPASEHLRFGQYFYNRFLGSTFGELKGLVDKIHAETDHKKALDMIEELYISYQWLM
jgi:hypothetical protein